MPSAANPWAVVSQQPAAAAPPPAAAAAQANPWSVAKETPSTPPAAPQQGGGFGDWAEKTFNDPNEREDWRSPEFAGGLKSAGQAAGSMLDLAHKIIPSQHIKEAADWLHRGSQPEGMWENLGAVGEQVLEFVGTDGLLKLAGPAIQGTATGARMVDTAKQLKAAQQVSEVLANHPRLAGLVTIGMKAVRDATLMGGQTYAHTEDLGQAAESAVVGGGLRVAAGGMSAAGRYLTKTSPKTIELAGEEIPALADQVKNGHAVEGGAGGAPAIAEAQQQGAQRVIRNLAQRATAQSIDNINATRPMGAPTITDAAHMLPAPEGSQPFTFTLETPPNESTAGQALHRAEPLPGSNTTPATYGKWTPKDPSTPYRASPNAPTDTAEPARFGPFERNKVDGVTREGRTAAYSHPATEASAIDTRTDTEKLDGAPGPRAAVEGKQDVTQHGPLQTTNPAEAQSWLRQLEEIQESPLHDKLSPAQQTAIESQRKALQGQLGLYHASPYGQRFVAENPFDAIENVRHFGDAADQIEGTAAPVFQTLDRASAGKFAKFRDAAKQASKIMRTATSLNAYESAQKNLTEANDQIDKLITRHADSISRTDYSAAKNAWRESSRLNELHTNFERMMNGITFDESEQGLNRVMTGRTKQFESYLAKGTNREQIEKLIGAEGIRNLKDLTLLLSKANTARSTVDVVKNVVAQLHGHAGIGGMIGGGVAEMLGIHWGTGVLAGAAATEGMRWVLRDAATNPRIGNAIAFAARNGMSPQIYAPLIARMMVVPEQQQQPREEGGGDADTTSDTTSPAKTQ
jgi:hypothetical protein